MKKIDELINRFKAFKEELFKGINESYSSPANETAKGEKMTMCKNGQWMLDKADYSGPAARALAAKHPMKPAAPVEHSGPAARALAAKHPMPSAPGAHAVKQNAILDARRANVLKVDPDENVNIAHPQKSPKMAQDPKHVCKKCGKGPCECA